MNDGGKLDNDPCGAKEKSAKQALRLQRLFGKSGKKFLWIVHNNNLG